EPDQGQGQVQHVELRPRAVRERIIGDQYSRSCLHGEARIVARGRLGRILNGVLEPMNPAKFKVQRLAEEMISRHGRMGVPVANPARAIAMTARLERSPCFRYKDN